MTTADDPLPDLIRALRNPAADQRALAAKALGRLGWLAREALPLLAAAVSRDSDGGVREAAAQAVGQMGPDALPHLVEMLDHSDKYVRRNAVWALGRLGPLALDALPDLCAALKDPDPRAAAGAAEALGKIGSDAVPAIPHLVEAMRGTNIVLCRLAAKALSQIGRPAIATLTDHLRHRDPFVRGEAALAIGWIGPPAAVAIPTLIELLAAGASYPMGESYADALLGSKTPVTAVTPAPAGPPPDDASRAHAAQALGRMGSAAAAAVPLLEKTARERNEQVRQSSIQALRLIRGS